jgi:hypothetical protein
VELGVSAGEGIRTTALMSPWLVSLTLT